MTEQIRILTPSGFVIENAAEEDLDELEKVEAVCFPSEPWSRKMILEELANPDALFVVVREPAEGGKGRIAGYLIAWLIPPFECQVGSIAVLPQFRRNGLAAAMLKLLCGSCSRAEIEDIYLEVRVSNTPAIELYKRFSFEIKGVRRNYYQDGEDAYNMARLGEDADGRTMI